MEKRFFQKPKGNIDLRPLSEGNGHRGELLQILPLGREKSFISIKGGSGGSQEIMEP